MTTDDETPATLPPASAHAELQVVADAEPEVVEAAYRALQRKYSFSPPGSQAAERLARVEAAWANLKGLTPAPVPGGEDMAAPVASPPLAPARPAQPIGQGRLFIIAGLVGLIVLLIGALAAGTIFLLTDDDGGGSSRYPVGLDDGDYDLEAMGLIEDDMLNGIIEQQTETFTNVEWAELFSQVYGDVDPERKMAQLDAQGRLRNRVAYFSRPQEEFVSTLGKIRAIESHSTLYTDEAAASEALNQAACGLLISDNEPTIAFTVPKIADESVGFYYEEDLQQLGKSVDTVVCFRTGRIVHAVVRTGLDGTQSTTATIELARVMLSHVNAVFFPSASDGDGT